MLLPNTQDILPEEKPRLICGLGLPGISFIINKNLIKYQVFHLPGDTINLLFFHFNFFLIGMYHLFSLMKFLSQLEFEMYNVACLVCSLLKKFMNFRLAFKRIEDLMLDL